MSVLELVALGVIIMGGIIFYIKNKKPADIILFNRDAEVRAKWKAEQAAREAEIDARIKEFRAKKEQYQLMRNKTDAEIKKLNNPGSLSNNNTPADVLVIQRPSSSSTDKNSPT